MEVNSCNFRNAHPRGKRSSTLCNNSEIREIDTLKDHVLTCEHRLSDLYNEAEIAALYGCSRRSSQVRFADHEKGQGAGRCLEAKEIQSASSNLRLLDTDAHGILFTVAQQEPHLSPTVARPDVVFLNDFPRGLPGGFPPQLLVRFTRHARAPR